MNAPVFLSTLERTERIVHWCRILLEARGEAGITSNEALQHLQAQDAELKRFVSKWMVRQTLRDFDVAGFTRSRLETYPSAQGIAYRRYWLASLAPRKEYLTPTLKVFGQLDAEEGFRGEHSELLRRGKH